MVAFNRSSIACVQGGGPAVIATLRLHRPPSTAKRASYFAVAGVFRFGNISPLVYGQFSSPIYRSPATTWSANSTPPLKAQKAPPHASASFAVCFAHWPGVGLLGPRVESCRVRCRVPTLDVDTAAKR